MAPVLFCIPIKPEKYHEYEAFVAAVTLSKKAEYQDMLRRYGLKNAKVWHHILENTQYLITMHEITPKAEKLLEEFATSKHPFDKWFHDECLKIWNVPSFAELPKQPTFIYEVNA